MLFSPFFVQLRKTFSGKLPLLPPRTFIGDALAVDVIESRKSQLQNYLRVLTTHPEWWCEPLASFCGVVDVVKRQDVKQEEPSSSVAEERVSVTPADVQIEAELDHNNLPVRHLDAEELEEQERLQDEMFEL